WYVARSEAAARAAHGIDAATPLRQDDDVLDTWFSSALWPFSTQGWPEKTPALQTYYPTAVLVTGFDIIFFWVARMIMMGLKFTGDVPFRAVYIHGLIRDQDGQKMSKSKGNVIDPLDIVDGISLDALLAKRTTGLMQPQMKSGIEKATRKQFPQGIAAYGTDALRLCLARLATQSRDLRFDMAKVEEYRNFCNKLWNAARYVLMNVEDQDLNPQGAEYSLADRWIRSRLAGMLTRIEAGFADYRLDNVANALYEFTWHEFCDWYVELSKAVLQSESASPAAKRGTRFTLVQTLETLLRALHPLAPFISEEIWQRVRVSAGVTGETIMRTDFPTAAAVPTDTQAEPEMRWVMDFVLGVRQIKGEMDIAMSRKLEVLLQNVSARDAEYLERNLHYLMRLAGVETPRVLAAGQAAPIAAVALLGNLEILVPMKGLIDPTAELDRLAKRLRKAEIDLSKLEVKLGNSQFAKNAPPDIVAKDQQRVEELRTEIGQLSAQTARVTKLTQ
ncbi:MAG TPA: class I tRNA ligase family protein, partial [Steroidobacteraceae bacterium]|nr:class I tRNA ligase family protein [Steroidobacteraceae bacterium]